MISVVMPAHNEEAYLASAVTRVVEGLRDRELDFEVIVSENGSTDLTAAQAEQVSEKYPEVSVLRSPAADYGRALKAGFLAATGEVIVDFDVDFVDLGFLDRALALMVSSGPAIIVGSKRSPGSDDQRRLGRKAVTAVFSFVLRHGFGLRVSDTHGVKALRRADLLSLVRACQFGGDIFDTELVIRAERAGLAVCELPVTVTDERPPRTSIARRIPRSLLGLARLALALRRHPGAAV